MKYFIKHYLKNKKKLKEFQSEELSKDQGLQLEW